MVELFFFCVIMAYGLAGALMVCYGIGWLLVQGIKIVINRKGKV